jgi:hypothetical protein
MNSDPDDANLIDDDLPPDVLLAIGQITTTWAQFDAFISAAFFSILNIDPVDFGIIVGRTESPTKLGKMQQIFKHRRDPRKAAVMKKAKELIEGLRPLRNTLTHGRYIGKSTKEEFIFILPAEFVIGEEVPTANEMVVVKRSDPLRDCANSPCASVGKSWHVPTTAGRRAPHSNRAACGQKYPAARLGKWPETHGPGGGVFRPTSL